MSLLHSDTFQQTWPWHCVGRDVQLVQEKDNLAFELNFKNAWCEFCCRKAQPIIKRRNIWGEIAEEEIVTLFYLDLTCLKTSVNQTQLLFFAREEKRAFRLPVAIFIPSWNLHYRYCSTLQSIRISNASRILVFWSHSGNLCLRTQNSSIIHKMKLPFISEKKFKTCYKAFYSFAWEFLQIYLCQSLGIG